MWVAALAAMLAVAQGATWGAVMLAAAMGLPLGAELLLEEPAWRWVKVLVAHG